MELIETVVIGAGINGSSAAYHLAKNGKKVVLIDQFPVPHARGSSGGQSRIIRQANYTGMDAMTSILSDAFQRWLLIQKEADEHLLRECNVVYIGKSSQDELMQKVFSSIEKSNNKASRIPNEDFNTNKKTTFSSDSVIINEHNAGVLMADKCLRALQSLFLQYGGKLLDEWPVHSISVSPEGIITVAGPKGQLMTEKLVICAGPWTQTLLHKLGHSLPLRPVKVGVFYWEVLEKTSFADLAFVDLSIPELHVYGLPDIEYPDLIKICYHGGPDIDPDKRDLADLSEIKQKMCHYVSERFAFLRSTPVIEESCIYTVTPDEQMILDAHPLYKNIVFGCGFSGTGFKTGPTVGMLLCELLEGSKPSFDVTDFRADRFNRNKLRTEV